MSLKMGLQAFVFDSCNSHEPQDTARARCMSFRQLKFHFEHVERSRFVKHSCLQIRTGTALNGFANVASMSTLSRSTAKS